MAAECRTKRARRSIPNSLGNVGNVDLVVPKQIFRERHAPPQKVFHRRHADVTGETIKERRARQRSLFCEFSHRPGTSGFGVNLADCFRQPHVAQTTQQSRRGFGSWCQPQRLDQQNFNEAAQYPVASRSMVGCLVGQKLHQSLQSFNTANMNLLRE